jgi:hypothetical protein
LGVDVPLLLPPANKDLLRVRASSGVSLVGVAPELLDDSAGVFCEASEPVVEVCLEAGEVLLPCCCCSDELLLCWLENLGRSPAPVGVDGVASVFRALSEEEEASCPLFCFLILAISSSSLTWRAAAVGRGGMRLDGLDSDC